MTPITATQRILAVAALLGVAAAAPACGTANPGGQASNAPSTAGQATTPAAAPGGNGCATSALAVRVDTAKASGAAGSIYYPIQFTNISGTTCTLYGFPGVSFVTGKSGTQIGDPASRNKATTPTTVSLAPGGVAHASLQIGEAGNYDPAQCKPVTAHWLRIYPPNQTTPMFTKLTTQVCSVSLPSGVGTQLSVYAVRSGAGGNGP